MRNLAELGLDRSSAVDDLMIARIVDRVGHPLPRDSVDFVKHADGAQPAVNGVRFADEETIVDSFFAIDAAPGDHALLDYVGIPGFPAGILPFARDPGDAFFCLDLANGGLVVFHHPDSGRWSKVAGSFGEFIDALIEL